MEGNKKTAILDGVWKFFASVRLTIVILIVLAFTSIIGTIIEQQAEPVQNIKLLAKFFGDSSAPALYNMFVKLGFMDMYHSWWFVSILLLFSINLVVCTLERFPKTWRLIKTPQKPMAENVIKTLPIKKELNFKSNLKTVKEEFLKVFKSSGFHIHETGEGESIQLYSEKGKNSHLGLYVVHLSIILILIGAIIGARFGFNAFLNLPEGETSDVAYMQGGKIIPLGFTIKCNWFNTEYYAERDMPKEFQSELVIIDKGREVMKKIIEVNSPLSYKGITFYQSSYGMVPNAVGTFILRVTSKGGQESTLRLKPGESFEIPGANIKGTIVNFSPALTVDRATGRLTTFAENMINPAVAIEFDGTEMGKFVGWILKRHPETGVLPDGSKIKFEDYWGVEYTGLQVSRDPGVGVIYFACIIMTLGLYIAFFMSHKRIWIRLTNDKKSVRVIAGGSASKNRLSFEREIENILSKASIAIEGRSKK